MNAFLLDYLPIIIFLGVAIVIGLGFKVSAAPFHVWTPDVYQGAPAPVVGLMSTAPKAAAFAVLLRILFSGYAIYQPRWQILMAILSVLSMCIGNLGALMQRDVKRMLAYSSIAHAGYLIAAFTAVPTDGIAAAAFYSAAYAVTNVGAFIVIGLINGREERLRSGEDYTGLALRHPLLGAAFSFFLLSMIGIPFTAGFFGKFYVFTAVLHSGHVNLAIIGLLNSGVACFYYLRLIVRVYSNAGDTVARHGARARTLHGANGGNRNSSSRYRNAEHSVRSSGAALTPLPSLSVRSTMRKHRSAKDLFPSGYICSVRKRGPFTALRSGRVDEFRRKLEFFRCN